MNDGVQDEVQDEVQRGSSTGVGDAGPAGGVSEESGGTTDGIASLLSALEGADDLSLDARLELLRSAEARIAGVLEGLDGL
jgi:hypothetical protein